MLETANKHHQRTKPSDVYCFTAVECVDFGNGFAWFSMRGLYLFLHASLFILACIMRMPHSKDRFFTGRGVVSKFLPSNLAIYPTVD